MADEGIALTPVKYESISSPQNYTDDNKQAPKCTDLHVKFQFFGVGDAHTREGAPSSNSSPQLFRPLRLTRALQPLHRSPSKNKFGSMPLADDRYINALKEEGGKFEADLPFTRQPVELLVVQQMSLKRNETTVVS